MAEDVRSDIIINVDTSVGIAEIKNLQRQISALNAQLLKSGAAQARAAENIQRNLINNINATGKFAASVQNISSTTETFTTRLEKNKFSLGEYFRYAGGASKTFGRLFRSEFDTIEKVARERVKTLQTQYTKLSRSANGSLQAIAVRPLVLDMNNLATQTAMAAQKQQIFNQLLKQGSTNLLNFGKNTQWAGRQLMVGFSIPLAYLGTLAAKTFMEMEEQAIRFKRVYGDSFTATSETDKMIVQIKDLANEFTKYGVAVEKTMKMAADAAAMGKMGSDLLAQVGQATRLAVLGGVEQDQALQTTISLTNAFGLEAEKLAGKINFLNAVENQTVTSIEDLTVAIPKAGPVVQQLGGDVEDLAFFLTAMREGGINASEGANALKSGLASLINPTDKAAQMLKSLGINLKEIVEVNKGDVKAVVIEFAEALDTLDPLNRSKAIEQLFGKFQFARLSTLFQNVIQQGTQAERVLKLSRSTVEELAVLSERELKRIEESPMYKFKKTVEDLKTSLVPLGEAFLKAVTPIIEFVKGFLDKFNEMSDGAKQFAVLITTVIAGIGPVLLMTFGLIANGVANIIKLFAAIRGTFSNLGNSSQILGSQTDYLTQQQLEAAAVAASLDQKHAKLIQTFSSETGAVNSLAAAYARAVVAQSRLLGVPLGGKAGKPPKKYAKGVVSVPGPKGAGDVVPAMLSPGEAVIPSKMAARYSGLISAMVDGKVPGYYEGTASVGNAKRTNLRFPDSFGLQASHMAPGTDLLDPNTAKNIMNREIDKLISEGVIKEEMVDRSLISNISKNVKLNSQTIGLLTGTFNQWFTNSKSVKDLSSIVRELSKTKGMVGGSLIPNLEYLSSNKMIQSVNEDTTKKYLNDLDKTFRYMVANSKQKNLSERQLQDIFEKAQKTAESKITNSSERESIRKANLLGRSTLSPAVPGTGQTGRTNLQTPLKGYSDAQKLTREPKNRKEIARLSGVVDKWTLKNSKYIVGSSSQVDRIKNLLKTLPPKESKQLVSALTESDGSTKALDEIINKVVSGKKITVPATQKAKPKKPVKAPAKNNQTFNLSEILGPTASKVPSGKAGLIAKLFGSRFAFGTSSVKPLNKLSMLSGMLRAPGVKHGYAEGLLRLITGNRKGMYNSEQNYYQDSVAKSFMRSNPKVAVRMQDEDLLKLINSKDKRYKSLFETQTSRAMDTPDKRAFAENKLFGFGENLDPRQRPVYGYMFKQERNLRNTGNQSRFNLFEALTGKKRTMFNRSDVKQQFDRTTGSLMNPKTFVYGNTAMVLKNRNIKDRTTFTYGDSYNAANERFATPARLGSRSTQAYNASKTSLDKDFFEAQILGGFTLKDVKKIVVTQPELIPILQSALRAQGLKIPVGMPKFTMLQRLRQIISRGKLGPETLPTIQPEGAYSNIPFGFKVKGYNSGVVSVPGPKGAGDVVPAMLSPGEAVIPTKMAKKYAPLISSMISGNIPGYEGGYDPLNDPFRAPTTTTLNAPKFDADPFGSSSGFDAQEENKEVKRKGRLFNKEAFNSRNIAATAKNMGTAFLDRVEKNAEANRGILGKLVRGAALGLASRSGHTIVDSKGNPVQQAGLTQGPKGGYRDAETGKYVRPEVAAQRISAVQGQQAVGVKQPGAIAGKLAAIGGVASMGAMMYGMSGAPGADVANQVAMPLMMLSMVLPMIASKTGMVVAGLLAAAGAIAYLVIQANEAAKAGLAAGKAMSMTNEKLEEFAAINGVVTSSQEAQKLRENQLSGESAKKRVYGQNFLESEAGKMLLSDAESMAKSGKTNQEIAENFSNQLSYAVLQGSVTQDQAASIAAALGEKLQDYSITSNIVGNLTALYGRNGENLLTDPLSISMDIQNKAAEQQRAAFDNATALGKKNEEISGGNLITGIAGGLMTAAGAVMTATGILAPLGIGLMAGGAATMAGATAAEIGADAAENNKARGVAVQLGVEQLAQNQGLLDSLTDRYNTEIKNLEVKKESAKTDKERADLEQQINDKIAKRDSDIAKQKQANSEILDSLIAQAQAMGPDFSGTIGVAIDEAYKNEAGALKAAAQMAKEALAALPDQKDGEPNTFKTVLQLSVASKELNPVVATNLVNAAAKDETLETNFNMLVSAQGTAEANQIIQLLGKAGVKAENYSVILDYVNKNPQAFKNNTEALAQIANMAQEYGITVDLNVNGEKKIAGVRQFLDQTGGLKGKPVTRKIITEYMASHPNMDATTKANLEEMLANWKVLTGGDNKINYQVMVDYVIGKTNDAAIWAYYISKNPELANANIGVRLGLMPKARADFFAEGGDSGNKTGDDKKGGDTGATGTRTEVLDELLKRLQNVRRASVDAKGGMTELMSLLKKGSNFAGFRGIEQQLSLKGYNEEFIRFMADADKADQKRFMSLDKGVVKLKASGKALQNLFAAVTLGNFERDIKQSVRSSNQELKARNTILSMTKMSYAEAAEAARDAGLAEAIAAIKANSAIKNKKKAIREAIDLYKEEKAALESIKTSQEQFEDIYGAQMDLFNAKQRKIDIDFNISTDSFSDAVIAAQADIDKLVNQPGGLDDLQAGLEKIAQEEDAINSKYDKRIEALNEVDRANERIAERQKSQLSVAEALSRGDISAAAKAVQELRAAEARESAQTQREALEKSRDAELLKVSATVNNVKKTRKQIESEILKIENSILSIEETRLEPNRELIRLATVERDLKLDALEDEKLKWDDLKVKIDLAAASASEYLKTLTQALPLAQQAQKDQVAPITPSSTPVQQPGTPNSFKGKRPGPDHDGKKKGEVWIGPEATWKWNGKKWNKISNVGKNTGAKNFSSGGIVPAYLRMGGLLPYKSEGGSIFKPLGTDTIPAMLSPGEFVMSRYAVDNFGVDNMKAINSGTYSGDSVYNYSINVNVQTDANANDIARNVMTEIRRIDSQRIRGNRF